MMTQEVATESDVDRLGRRIAALEAHLRRAREDSAACDLELAAVRDRPAIAGHATGAGCARFAAGFGKESLSFYRPAQDLLISNIGIGTSRGATDARTDARYAEALEAALRGGINLIDTSLNYRLQRSECAVGTALRRFLANGKGRRDGIVVCSKGGYLVPGAISPDSLPAADTAFGFHAMSPAFLADQLERSRRNLGLETIDVYYLHNPEVERPFLGAADFRKRLRRAFAQLERCVTEGRIRYYGIATWSGFQTGVLSLSSLLTDARSVGGAGHRLRFLQLPVNLGMLDPATTACEDGRTLLEAAADAGITVVASASLAFADRASENAAILPGSNNSVLRAIQSVRSTPGIASALVGMGRKAHVLENLSLAKIAPAGPAPKSA